MCCIFHIQALHEVAVVEVFVEVEVEIEGDSMVVVAAVTEEVSMEAEVCSVKCV